VQVPGRNDPVWLSPMFQQYWAVRDTLPDNTLLFFRMGDFFEIFGRDAVIAAPILEVQLTARAKDAAVPVPMCGVPYHALNSYLSKALSAGWRVALADQLSEPQPGKKLVERGVVRIFTPGLGVDPEQLDSKKAAWLLCLVPKPGGKSLDVLLYDFLRCELLNAELGQPAELAELMRLYSVRECLLPEAIEHNTEWIRRWHLSSLAEHRQLSAFGSAQNALELLKNYLQFTQPKHPNVDLLLSPAQPIALFNSQQSQGRAQISSDVLSQWAVFPELFDLLDGCASSLGSRRLHKVLTEPLRSIDHIEARQKLLSNAWDADDILSDTREIYDLERILGRFRVSAASHRELFQLRSSLRALSTVVDRFKLGSHPDWARLSHLESLQSVESLNKPVAQLLERLDATLADDAQSTQHSDLVRVGFDDEFDHLKSLSRGASDWLAQFETRLQSETGIGSLKVRYNRVFGYFIEVTKVHLAKIPSYFERKQTTVNGERFTCVELRNKEHEILTASLRLEAKAEDILKNLVTQVLECDQTLRAYFEHGAWIDLIAGVKLRVRGLRRFGPWTFAKFNSGPFAFRIVDGRHPVVEARAPSFVPNSIELGSSDRVLLLTGPNMAGKSTLMRQCGLLVLLSQCGLPVPAAEMSLSPTSAFYSRMGATDRILEGESTFMVEMKECARILSDADQDSLVLIDEIGRGTSTQDGLAIAHAVLEHIVQVQKSICIFATHYHELSEVTDGWAHLRNASMGIREHKGELIFLRRLENKAAESSYGIYVAKLAGIHAKILKRAQTLFDERSTPQFTLALKPKQIEQSHNQSLALIEDLAHLEVNDLSPKAAWAELESLSARARSLLSREDQPPFFEHMSPPSA
jgi:DNA mismatch repair protein MutS